jgi:hypothetical protein
MLRRGGRSSVSRLLAVVAAGLLLGGAGCARFGAVSGKVYYRGKPLTGGMVHFYGPHGSVETSPIAADGGYTVRRVPAGPAKVAVSTPAVGYINIHGGKPPVVPGEKTPPHDSGHPSMPLPPAVTVIPTRYADPEQSGLTFEVQPGDQEHDVRIE